jgi:hypothetical protein
VILDPDPPPITNLRGRSWLALLVIGLSTLWAASSAVNIAHVVTTGHWPTTTGVITRFAVRPESLVIVPGSKSGIRRFLIEDRLQLSYDYTVDGHTYSSTRLSILPPSTREATYRARTTYQQGRQILVHYDPSTPATAVLDTTIPGGQVLQLILSVIVAASVWTATRTKPGRSASHQEWRTLS